MSSQSNARAPPCLNHPDGSILNHRPPPERHRLYSSLWTCALTHSLAECALSMLQACALLHSYSPNLRVDILHGAEPALGQQMLCALGGRQWKVPAHAGTRTKLSVGCSLEIPWRQKTLDHCQLSHQLKEKLPKYKTERQIMKRRFIFSHHKPLILELIGLIFAQTWTK